MCCGEKAFLILVALTWELGMAEAKVVRGDLVSRQPGLGNLQLGDFGPVSGLPSHPTFAHLGFTPQQSVGLVDVLLRHGLLNPNAVRLANGQPVAKDFGPHFPPGTFFGDPGYLADPYFWFLMTNYERYLPFGLGPQGIYGSTGLPRPRPAGVFKYSVEN